jgi:hypothetical protein
MTQLRNLTLSFILISALAVVALAGDTNSPRCIPGQLETPPCSQSVTDGSTDPGEMNGPPSSAVDLTTIVGAVEAALSLF